MRLFLRGNYCPAAMTVSHRQMRRKKRVRLSANVYRAKGEIASLRKSYRSDIGKAMSRASTHIIRIDGMFARVCY